MSITDFGVCYVFNAGSVIRQSTKPGIKLANLTTRQPHRHIDTCVSNHTNSSIDWQAN